MANFSTDTDLQFYQPDILDFGIASFIIVGFVKGTDTNIDTKRNELISTIEKTLENDRTRGGYAKRTEVVEVSTDEGTLYPIGGIRIVVRVMYQYTAGTP
jgi:hypothetical protein